MKTKAYVVCFVDYEFGETEIRGVYRYFEDAASRFREEIAKELVFNILNYCDKNEDTKWSLINTVPSDMNEVGLITAKGTRFDSLDDDVINLAKFEEELCEFSFWCGEQRRIMLTETNLYS